MSFAELTLHDAADKLRKREFTAVELTEAVYERIAETEPRVCAYLTLAHDSALEDAARADEKRKNTASGAPLLGIPLAIKDNFLTKGVRTTCASKILGDFLSPYDATVISKIRSAGAVIIGKTNLDEFAMGSSAENSAFFPTHNPWNLERIPGGSSGGSAAAVAADECTAALGTDTGGSIRQPAACCGVVGLKPTYGRVSRFGIIAFASSMDQVGPMTKDVRDSALLLEAIAGYDPADSTSVNSTVPRYSEMLAGDIKRIRVGVPKEYFASGVAAEVKDAVRKAIGELEKQGAVIEEISLPSTEYAIAVYYIVATAEASSNLARYDGMRYGHRANAGDLLDTYTLSRAAGFGAEVKRRIMLGTYVLSAGYYDAYYLKAQKVRTLIKQDFDVAFKRCDLIATPTAPTTAFRLGEKIKDPLQMYLSDVCTISVNLAGLPAVSLPCGFDQEGMPIGMQLIGKHFDEATILRVAHHYEQSTPWHKRKPKLQDRP
ncbi:MAG TPA: Asp-tRNA(Asn)/Glu-tRNA(Gln) amidotransferase subunit GatA [Candidatus Binatia bacterium]|nr:Asp-tRNA(Asn)/Glu-tRNA(Gln) amidotransferase subunit GatA [Candidatus Binatia bacterium]